MKLGSAILIFFSIWLLACNNQKPSQTFVPTGDPQIDTLSMRIMENPEDGSLYHKRAARYVELRKPTEALEDINKAISFDPDNIDYRILLSDIYFQMGKITDSRSILEQVKSTHPDNVDIILKLAEISLYFKEYPKTEAFLDEAEAVDKRDPRLHFMRGYMYKDRGDTLAALRSFYKTVEYDTTNYNAYMQLGILYAAKRNPLAVEFYHHSRRLKPNNVEPLYNLGMFYQQQEDLNAAIKAYTDALEIDPKYKYAHFALGYIHVELKIYSEAARYFTSAIASDPSYIEGYYGRGYALEMMGDVLNAKEDYMKVLQMNPNHEGAKEGLQRINRLPPL